MAEKAVKKNPTPSCLFARILYKVSLLPGETTHGPLTMSAFRNIYMCFLKKGVGGGFP